MESHYLLSYLWLFSGENEKNQHFCYIMKRLFHTVEMINFRRFILLQVFSFVFLHGISQVGILTVTPDHSAALDVTASDKGLLTPRVTLTADLNNPAPVNQPASGLLIFNTGPNQPQGFYYWTGTKWQLLVTPTTDGISGPPASTDNAIVRFDGNNGDILQNSVVVLDDNGDITGVNHLTINGFMLTTSPVQDRVLASDASGNASWQQKVTFNVEENDTLVAANLNELNFEGGINVKNSGVDKATVTFFKNVVSRSVIQLGSSSTINLNDLVNPVAVPWNIEQNHDYASYIHSNTVNPSRITVRAKGIYELNFMFAAINKSVTRKTLRIRVRKNGTDYFPNIACYSFSYQSADLQISHVSPSFLIQLESNDYIEMMSNGQTNEGNLNMMPNENVFFMRLIRLL